MRPEFDSLPGTSYKVEHSVKNKSRNVTNDYLDPRGHQTASLSSMDLTSPLGGAEAIHPNTASFLSDNCMYCSSSFFIYPVNTWHSSRTNTGPRRLLGLSQSLASTRRTTRSQISFTCSSKPVQRSPNSGRAYGYHDLSFFTYTSRTQPSIPPYIFGTGDGQCA